MAEPLPLVGRWGRVAEVEVQSRHVVHVRGNPAPLHSEMLRAQSLSGGHALMLGPDEWLLVDAAPPTFINASSTVDVTGRQISLRLSGLGGHDLLAGGCPLDTNLIAFPVSMATRTIYGKAEIVLWRETVDCWRIEIWRSFATYLIRNLECIARELDN